VIPHGLSCLLTASHRDGHGGPGIGAIAPRADPGDVMPVMAGTAVSIQIMVPPPAHGEGREDWVAGPGRSRPGWSARSRARGIRTGPPAARSRRRALAARSYGRRRGLAAAGEMIARYRGGGRFTSDDEIARLTAALRDLRVRDDAWARMDPAHTDAPGRSWRRSCCASARSPSG